MVITLQTEKVEVKQLTVKEIAEAIGLPVVVRPWWGSVRRSFLQTLNQVQVDETGAVDEMKEVARQRHFPWLCPADFGNQKRNPEVRGGKIILWQGSCHYDKGYRPHTHRQIIEVKDARYHAMLITIGLGNTKSSFSQFLLGMDSGRPYAVQVVLQCQTINEALSWLVPKMVRDAVARGLDVKRQGDWYFVPHNREPNLHEWDDTLLYGLYKRNHLYRNRELVYHGAATRHRATFVVYNCALGLPCEAPIVKGKVRAPDHAPLILDQWHLGIRNRSHPWRNTHRDRRMDD